MKLETPDKIRDLQRGLYLKAKREPKFRFYLLHDKVWREDILKHAYRLVRANGGAPGIDGETFQSIESGEGEAKFVLKLQQELKEKTYRAQAVRRVYIPKADGKKRPLGIPTIRDRVAQMAVKLVIEPIFEADFEECSYGFRPKRDAHQAVGAIRQALYNGHAYVFDADLNQYFDTIPHSKLLTLVAHRISDRHILGWIKQWLMAVVVEEDEEGKRRTRKAKRGTPQGGVLSPLLANIYLHLFDRALLTYCQAAGLAAQLVRYADDFVILMCAGVNETLLRVKQVLGRMELTLNEEKSRVVDAREGGFNFLGFAFCRKRNRQTGKGIILVEPSRKSQLHFREEVRHLTGRWSHCLREEEVLDRVNRYVRGWVNYFHLYNSTRPFRRQRFFLEQRIRKYLQKRRQRKGFGMKRWSTTRLYRELGLCNIPVHAPYRRTRMP
ncbi:MAG TPA: group II intron reverse transcriptase/maturase [Candidatus Binatia bacterium]|nr:group II intron reverse transcriptase/maturase [Candidatus Binatia bacterium]